MTRKNSKDWVEIRDTPPAAPPPAPARALQTISGKLEHAKRNHAHRPIVLSWEDAETIKTVLQVAAHLQAELERVRKQGTDAVLDLKEQMREMKVRHNDDLKAAEARCRVLGGALANLLNVMKYSIGVGLRTPGQKDAITAAERALASQEK